MKISTLSVVVGTQACNASCPCCISKMTPKVGIVEKPSEINYRNLGIACKLAISSGVSTALITGKGEPTLFPDTITKTVDFLSDAGIPLIELQTNGVVFNDALIIDHINTAGSFLVRRYLKRWYNSGMTLICLSVMHADADKNKTIMGINENQIHDYWKVVDLLHSFGFAVRINLTLTKKFMFDLEEDFYPIKCAPVDDQFPHYTNHGMWDQLKFMLDQCKYHKIEQLTIRDVSMPDGCSNEIAEWVKKNKFVGVPIVEDYFKFHKTNKLMNIGHGATVYDCDGQNVCINNCLTESTNPEEIRQLIYFPDGKIRYSWQYESAIII